MIHTIISITFILIGNLPGKLVFLLVYCLPYWAIVLRNYFSIVNDYEEVEEVRISSISFRCSMTISEEYYQTHTSWYHSSWVWNEIIFTIYQFNKTVFPFSMLLVLIYLHFSSNPLMFGISIIREWNVCIFLCLTYTYLHHPTWTNTRTLHKSYYLLNSTSIMII